jgi:hypothetical protein
MGLDTKTYYLTDRQSQCDFDFDFVWSLEVSVIFVIRLCLLIPFEIADSR